MNREPSAASCRVMEKPPQISTCLISLVPVFLQRSAYINQNPQLAIDESEKLENLILI